MENNNLKVLKRLWLLSCSQKIKSNIKILKPVFISKFQHEDKYKGT